MKDKRVIYFKLESLDLSDPITPTSVDIKELARILDTIDSLISPPSKGKEREKLTIEFEESSLLAKIFTASALAYSFQNNLIKPIANTNSLITLSSRQSSGIDYFLKAAKNNKYKTTIYSEIEPAEKLVISPDTSFDNDNWKWIEQTMYVYGKIIKIGGKGKNRFTLETISYKTLNISASVQDIIDLSKNYVYKFKLMKIKCKKNIFTGELDKTSLVYQNIIEQYNPKYNPERIKRIHENYNQNDGRCWSNRELIDAYKNPL